MLSYDTAQLHLFSVLTEEVHQLLAARSVYASGNHRFNSGLCRVSVEAVGIVARKLALEREPCEMLFSVTKTSSDILEAPLGDEAEPPCVSTVSGKSAS